MADTTPLMNQYRKVKAELTDEILFFRLGDFYEMFFQDAIEVSGLLNLTLTHRNGNPMCGIPYHSSKSYIARLLKAGKKIAICEQLTPPGKGIIERKIVEIVTPGTIIDADYLKEAANNYLAALCRTGESLSWSYLDVSTGEFKAGSCPAQNSAEWFSREFLKISPREMLVQKSLADENAIAGVISVSECFVNALPDWTFDPTAAFRTLTELFSVSTLKGFGFEHDDPSLVSAGALIDYLKRTANRALGHFTKLSRYDDSEYLQIDDSSQKNLEIIVNLHDGTDKFTLFDAINMTVSAPGERLLRKRLLFPFRDPSLIQECLDMIDYFYHRQKLLSDVRERLGKMRDAERLAAKVAMDRATVGDLLSLANACKIALSAADTIAGQGDAPPELTVPDSIGNRIKSLMEITGNALEIHEDENGGEAPRIKTGYSAELDRLRALKRDSRSVLERYVEEERQRSGINGLKLKYNRIIGYYLEISKAFSGGVPPHFLRRQSLSTGERYTTERLSELETEIGSSEELIESLERRLFEELRAEIKPFCPDVARLAGIVAEIDVASSNALHASLNAYCRPRIDLAPVLSIREGRHPVVEKALQRDTFVPNDIDLDADTVSFALITGPNMAGKSTFLRQTALIVLLAHAGLRVPASEATIGLSDRIFCRVGAQDNLARGESTFLVEMNETACILNTATRKSLVIMDEVGRGTGTVDGLSIAWSVSEYMLGKLGSRTLFATHYHELTAMEHAKLKNLSLETIDEGGEVVFLKRVIQGPAASSYGIHVAALAGLPSEVLLRARQLEKTLTDREGTIQAPARTKPTESASFELFSEEELVVNDIRSQDVDRLTPLEALTKIASWKKILS